MSVTDRLGRADLVARRAAMLLPIIILTFVTACYPSTSPRPRARWIAVEFDTATHVSLHYDSTPVAYDHVRSIRGRVLSAIGDTLSISVVDVAFFGPPGVTTPVLRTASRTGAPTARVVLADLPRVQRARAHSGNINASIAELALILRLAMILNPR